MNKALLLAAAAAIAGCTSVTDVTPMGKDTFMVGAEARGGIMSNTEVMQMAVKKANAYCASQSKVMEPTHVQSTGVRGWTPQEAEFVFQCLDPADPGYQRPKMQRDPNAVVEVR